MNRKKKKKIKICGLGSNMLKATQNIGWKYACDMLTMSQGSFSRTLQTFSS